MVKLAIRANVDPNGLLLSSPSIISIKVREALADRLTMTGNGCSYV